jgi:hypothetical protein
MGVRNENSTNYVHNDEPNILNLHKAMDYNALGEPIVRVSTSGSTSTGGIDAFGRTKISNPFTLFDSQHRYSQNDKFWTDVATNATVTHDANASVVNLNVTDENGSEAVMETKRVFPYQPGKALEIMATFTMDSAQTGLRQRVGYFSEENGIFLERDGDDVYLVLRSNSSGSVVENRVAQADWNTEILDGNGPTGITLNLDTSQILFVDIEWLGVGTVRAGFIIDGAFIIAHKFHHANIITGTYMATAALPIRYEITNTSVTASSATLKVICATVISNGGYAATGKQYTEGRGLTYYTMSTAGTFYHMASIKLNSARIDDVVIPSDVNVLTDSNQNLQYKLVLNATFATPLVYNSNSSVDWSITDSVVTDEGEVIASGYIVNKGEAGKLSAQMIQEVQLNRSNGVANVLSLIVTADSNNVKATGNFSWFEPLRG